MLKDNQLYVAHSDKPLFLVPKMSNRHGLIAGATGTGKTVSLQVLAESFSDLGVPCFMADMKGDLSGIYKAGALTSFIEKRQAEFGVTFDFQPYPARFFDVYGNEGHPLRVTVREFGVMLFTRVLDLNETQEGVLNAVFCIAEDEKMPLVDLKDLRAMLNYVGQHAKEYQTDYGNISSASIGAIQRGLLSLEEQGGDYFFGEPAFDVEKLIEQEGAKGVINILAADKLYNFPKLYSAFLMWLLNSLYSKLPEVGDMDKPKFIFFFDEAHLLFDDASKVLMEQIEKVVRLIRSKGVGVYFITQNPMDIPESVLGQLGNKIQHALRAFTPKDQKAVKKIAETFRQNEKFDTESTILELETGEALISFLDEKGAPAIVERAKMLCPQGQIGPLTAEERSEAIKKSRLYGVYEIRVERESASEILTELTEKELEEKEAEKRRAAEEKEAKKMAKEREKSSKKTSQKQSPFEKAMTKMLTSLGRSFGTKLINAIVKKIK